MSQYFNQKRDNNYEKLKPESPNNSISENQIYLGNIHVDTKILEQHEEDNQFNPLLNEIQKEKTLQTDMSVESITLLAKDPIIDLFDSNILIKIYESKYTKFTLIFSSVFACLLLIVIIVLSYLHLSYKQEVVRIIRF
jgi:hypothetical protein